MKNESSATVMNLIIPDTNMTVVYPSNFQGDLPPNGMEESIEIMGQEHVRYIIARDVEYDMGYVTVELIRGPVVDALGVRPYYQYPTGNEAGDQIAEIFASLQLE